jgi:hypothetical protein
VSSTCSKPSVARMAMIFPARFFGMRFLLEV